MKRYTLTLAYNGKNYFGWQIQPHQISVQETIEDALTKLHRNEPVKVVGCGRTDSGVHAKKYVLHFDFPEIPDCRQFCYQLNKMLPDDIAVFSCEEKTDDFHARFDAKARTYRYFVHTKKDCFNFENSWYVNFPVDFDKMQDATEILFGRQDFASFSKSRTDVKTTFCEISEAKWVKTGESTYYFEITADRFLRNMVRAIVGTLFEIGKGKMTKEEFRAIIATKDRRLAGTSVPGHALFLWEIEY